MGGEEPGLEAIPAECVYGSAVFLEDHPRSLKYPRLLSATVGTFPYRYLDQGKGCIRGNHGDPSLRGTPRIVNSEGTLELGRSPGKLLGSHGVAPVTNEECAALGRALAQSRSGSDQREEAKVQNSDQHA
jgi:hypothetical protein